MKALFFTFLTLLSLTLSGQGILLNDVADRNPDGSIRVLGLPEGGGLYPKEHIFDRDPLTFFAPVSMVYGAWAGIELPRPFRITKIRYLGRKGFPERMKGCLFQGADNPDFTNPVTLAEADPPPGWTGDTWIEISLPYEYSFFRYLRIMGASAPSASKSGYECGNVCELEFYGTTLPPGQIIEPECLLNHLAERNGDGEISVYGSEGCYGNNEQYSKRMVFDGNPGTFFAPDPPFGAWAGIKVRLPSIPTRVRYLGRKDYACRMKGCLLQASNDPDFTHSVTLSEINPPQDWDGTKWVEIKLKSTEENYLYFRILGSSSDNENHNGMECGNVSELEFYGTPVRSLPEGPVPPPLTSLFSAVMNNTLNVEFPHPESEAECTLEERHLDTTRFSPISTFTPERDILSGTGNLIRRDIRDEVQVYRISVMTSSGRVTSAFPVTNYFALAGSPIGAIGCGAAFDGDIRTLFTAQAEGERWIGLDFGGSCKVAGIRLLPGKEGVKGGHFELSDHPDFSSQTRLLSLPPDTLLERGGGVVPFTGKKAESGRYIRFVPSPGQPCQIAELEFITPSEESDTRMTVSTSDISTGYLTAKLNWSEPPGNATTRVYRSSAQGGPWHFIEEIPAGVTEWIDRGATGGIPLFYRLVFLLSCGGERVTDTSRVPHVGWQWLERDPEHPNGVKRGMTAVNYPVAYSKFPLSALFDNNIETVMQNDPKSYSQTLKFGVKFDDSYVIKRVRMAVIRNGRTSICGGQITGTQDDNWEREPPTPISAPVPKDIPVGWTDIDITNEGPWKCVIYRRIHNLKVLASEMQIWGYPVPPNPATLLQSVKMELKPEGKRIKRITWSETNQTEGYRVERRDLLGGWTCIHTAGKDGERSYIDQPPTSFSGWTSYRVVTFKEGGELYSNERPAWVAPFFGTQLILE